jgi:hypothetical protein
MRTRRSVERERLSRRVRIDMGVDRRAAEALALEISMLAKIHGLEVKQIEVTFSDKSATARPGRGRGKMERSDPSANPAGRGRRGPRRRRGA